MSMNILITEQQLGAMVHRYVLDTLKAMELKHKRNREFSMFPVGTGNPTYGIEADWMKGLGYDTLVGYNLWSSVRDTFGLSEDQVMNAFINALNEMGLKIYKLTTIDFSDVDRIINNREQD